MIRYLSQEDLRWRFLDFAGAKKLIGQRKTKKTGRIGTVAQDRALNALELGLGIKQRGYNIFVVGASGTGRTSTVEKLLKDRAKKEATPEDVVLLYNFQDKDRPLAIQLPPSMGHKLRKGYETLVEKVVSHIEKAFEADSYILARQLIQDECRNKTDDSLREIENEAKANSFVLSHAGLSITLTPANKKGEALTEEEFDELSNKEKIKLEKCAEKLEGRLEESMRKIRLAEKESEDAFEELERETARQAIEGIFENMKHAWKNYKRIASHLQDIKDDILAKIRRFVQDDKNNTQDSTDAAQNGGIKRRVLDDEDDTDHDEPLFVKYKVNVLVSHGKDCGAPVVFETHPTSSNIIGRIEQKLRAGETITDFTRIRAGALYRANGGFLILEAQELLRDPSAWEGLKRALKNREIELDDPGEPGRMISVASLRPEPVPLSLKVIMIGTPELYYALARNDPDFPTLFKVKADFDLEIERSDLNLSKYISFMTALCAEEDLLKLSPEGAAHLLEQAVRLSGNKNKITCRLGELADLLRESNYWAQKNKSKLIEPSHTLLAIKAKSEREGFIETQILDEVKSGKIIIETSGRVVGQTNALTVVEVGSYEFGVPLRITCQVGCGKGEIIDIEREAEQSGTFHSKGRLIIRGLLSNLFGKVLPFAFHATLCMEQTYSEVDGDSASLAETCALLSAISQVPIDQRFAMTGAIDQMGTVQAVGGINAKIEGFFRVCQEKNSKEVHGVLVPTKNVDDIMLNENVIEAIKQGKFNVISVDTVADAMEVLTGLKFEGANNSIYAKSLTTLKHFNKIRLNFNQPSMATPLGDKKKSKLAMGAV